MIAPNSCARKAGKKKGGGEEGVWENVRGGGEEETLLRGSGATQSTCCTMCKGLNGVWVRKV